METALDFALGETADMIRETTRRFAADRIAPKAADIDEQNKFDRSLLPEMGALGLHGITVAEEYGGLGLGQPQPLLPTVAVPPRSASSRPCSGPHSHPSPTQ